MAQNLIQLCSRILEEHSLEDASDILLRNHGIDIPVSKLINTVGKQSYLDAMRREVSFLRENGISSAQVAELWNELDRPGPDSGPWTEAGVSLLGY